MKKDMLFLIAMSLFVNLFWMIFYFPLGPFFINIAFFGLWMLLQSLMIIVLGASLLRVFQLNRFQVSGSIIAVWVFAPILLSHIDHFRPITILSADGFFIALGLLVSGFLGYKISKVLNAVFSPYKRYLTCAMVLGVLLPSNLFLSASFLYQPDVYEKPLNRIEKYSDHDWNGYKVAVFGIDGGDWNVILPAVEKGLLPNIEKLLASGAAANCISDLKYESPMLWSSIFSGLIPSRHGITNWRVSISYNRKAKALWNILNGYGLKGYICNIPGTYPIEVVEHGGISGFPLPSTFGNVSGRVVSSDDATLELYAKLKDRSSGKLARIIRVPPLGEGDANEVSIPLNLSNRLYDYTINSTLASKWHLRNFFLEKGYRKFFYNYYGNLEVEYRRRGDSALPAVEFEVKTVDGPARIGLRENQWSDFYPIRMGKDLGYFAIYLAKASANDIEFYVSPIFKDLSMLKVVYPKTSGIEGIMTPYFVQALGFNTTSIYPFRFHQLYRHNLKIANLHQKMAESLIEKSWDFFIFVHTVVDRIQHAFWPLHEPDAYGAADRYKKERETYGDLVESAMIEVDKNLGELLRSCDDSTIVILTSDHGFLAQPGTDETSDLGDHREQGIFLISGPTIKSCGFIPDVSIYDVTPTILYALGLPVAEDFDGKVIHEMFKEAYLDQHPIEYTMSYNLINNTRTVKKIGKNVEDQLKSLGYIK